MNFQAPEAIWLLLPTLLLAARMVLRPRRSAVVYSSLDLLRPVRAGWRVWLSWLPGALRIAAIICLIVAVARPRKDLGQTITSTQGVAIMSVIDRSASMTAPMRFRGRDSNRFDVVKDVFGDFVLGDGGALRGRASDMIGLILFAGYAETLHPLTLSHESVVRTTRQAPPAPPALPLGGTAIGDAVVLAASRLQQAEAYLQRINEMRGRSNLPPEYEIKSKVILLLTDGRQTLTNVIDPIEAAKIAAREGIKIYTIGVGGTGGVIFIPGMREGQMVPIRDDIDEPTLIRMAEMTGGRYWNARNASTLERIYQEFDALERSDIRMNELSLFEELFEPWAKAAAVLLLLELIFGSLLLRRLP